MPSAFPRGSALRTSACTARSLALALVWSPLVGCGSSDDGGKDGSGDTGGDAGSSTEPRASPGCGAGVTPAARDEKRRLIHGGVERSYDLHVPAAYDAAVPGPLLLNFHGFTPIVGPQASGAQASLSSMIAKSDSSGFVAVHPQGLLEPNGTTASWNAGTCCATDTTRDDVGYVRAILDEVTAALCIDERRVYVTGLSNGGMMSHHLGCRLADRIAAIAPVAGLDATVPCEPGRPVGVVAFHGTTDELVPYANGVAAVDEWVKRNGCVGEAVETYSKGDSRCVTHEQCAGGVEVELCTVEDGGHTWPDGADFPAVPGIPDLGKTTRDLSANDEMWSFFDRHRLP